MTARAQALHGATTAGFRIGDALAFVTDTAFDEGSAELARGVDHLVHEAWSTDPADPADILQVSMPRASPSQLACAASRSFT